MADRQIFGLTTRTLAATDVFPSQDAAGATEAGKATLQELKEFTSAGAKRVTVRVSVAPGVTATLLENDTTATISSATNPANGQVWVTFSENILTAGKTQILAGNINGGGTPYLVVGEAFGTNVALLNIFLHDGTQSGTPNFSNYIFTILIFP